MGKTTQRNSSSRAQGHHHTKSWTATDEDLECASRIRLRLFKAGIEPSRSEVVNVALNLAETVSDDVLIDAFKKRRS